MLKQYFLLLLTLTCYILCLLPTPTFAQSNVILTVSPNFLPADVEDLEIRVTGSITFPANAMVGFVRQGDQCSGKKYGMTNIGSGGSTFLLSGMFENVGTHTVCYSPDGISWFEQNAVEPIEILRATDDSFRTIIPNIIVLGNYPNIEIPQIIPMPHSQIFFANLADCTPQHAITSFEHSNNVTMGNDPAITVARPYRICFSTDGGKTNYYQTKIVLHIISGKTKITNLSPLEITTEELPVFSTSNFVNTSTSMIAFALNDCSGTVVGATPLLEAVSFQLSEKIYLAADYKVCFSVDSGATYTEQELTLAVISTPTPPLSLAGVLSTGSSIEVQWSNSTFDGNTPIQSYLIVAKDTVTNVETSTSIPAPANSGKVNVPVANRAYNIVVHAINKAGKSGSSNQITYFTLAPTIPGTVETLNIVKTYSTKAELSWDRPFEIGGAGTVEYFLGIYLNGDPDIVKSLTTTETSILIEELVPDTHYNVSILAKNSIGNGEPSFYAFTTLDGKVPGVPSNIVFLSATTTSISLTWEKPTFEGLNNDTILGYNVSYTREGVKYATGTRFMTVDDNSVIVLNLVAGASYIFKIASFNVVGMSKFTEGSTSSTVSLTGNVLQWLKDNYYYAIIIGVAILILIAVLIFHIYIQVKRRKAKRAKAVKNPPSSRGHELEDIDSTNSNNAKKPNSRLVDDLYDFH